MQTITNLNKTMYLQAAESYCIIVMNNGQTKLKSRPMKHFENHLYNCGWCRIHRSFIVNPTFIKQVSENRDSIYLATGTILPISRRQRKSVLKWRNSRT